MSHDYGYKQGKKMCAEMNGGGKVAVRGYQRGGPVRHNDAAQDKKIVQAMVKVSALTPQGKKGK